MKNHIRGCLLSLVVMIALIAGVCGFLYWQLMSGVRTPTDQQLIDHYIQHKTEFNQFVHMLQQENEFWLIYADGTCIRQDRAQVDRVDTSKCAEYVRLSKTLGLKSTQLLDDEFILEVYSSGLSVSGISMGYTYAMKPPFPPGTVVSSTDHAHGELPWYTPIDDNWYIYVDGN